MQTSNSTKPKPVEAKSLLLMGPAGGGKTTLAMQFPSPCFLDCDRNLDGAERFLRSKLPDLSYSYEQITYKNGKPLEPYECFDRLLAVFDEANQLPEIKTIVIDSLTLINYFILTKVQKTTGREQLQIPDWGKVQQHYIDLLIGRMRRTSKTVIVICHEEPVERPNASNPLLREVIRLDPLVTGGIRYQLCGLFTDVWRCYSKPEPGGKVCFVIETMKTPLSGDLKNSFGLPAVINIPQDKLAEQLKPVFTNL